MESDDAFFRIILNDILREIRNRQERQGVCLNLSYNFSQFFEPKHEEMLQLLLSLELEKYPYKNIKCNNRRWSGASYFDININCN